MTKNLQLTDLSRQLGELIHNWGFKRIHGRIWTRLYLSTRPLDAADLIDQLDISKALVSISLRELLDVKAVEEVGRSARGTNLFRANANINEIYLEVLKKREQKMLEQTLGALSLLSNMDAAELNSAEVSSAQMDSLARHLKTAMTMLNTYVAANDQASSVVTSSDAVVAFPSPANSSGITNASANQQSVSHGAGPFTSLVGSQNAMVLPARGG